MAVEQKFILLRHREVADIGQYDVYTQHDGYQGLAKALSMTPDAVIAEVKASNLRGRGGAGFPTGMKWSFVPKVDGEKYVAVNADESEPGTFKDREIMEKNPHQLIEGALICAYAIQATAVYIYCRGEFWDLAHNLEAQVEAARKDGWLGKNIRGTNWSCEVYVHLGAGAYICGEESALLNSIEGKLGQPRVRPPFPAVSGLYARPTVINNVETLASVPWIMVHGAAEYKKIGTEKSSGTKVFCMSGHIEKPGNYELPLGTTFRDLIELAGGGRNGKKIKAILPSGASGPLLAVNDKVLDTPLTYEDVTVIGSVLGSASVILLDEDTDMVWATQRMTYFFKHESCGKCTPCREGTYWMNTRMNAVVEKRAKVEDIKLLEEVAAQIQGRSLCALGDFAANPVLSSIKLFRDEYLKYVTPVPAPAPAKAAAPAKPAAKPAPVAATGD
jgi:NADH-quinone oxidoreductase subunit F